LYHLSENDFKNLDLSKINTWFNMAEDSRSYAGADIYNKVSYLKDLGLDGENI
jgi:hypothetical protein